MHQVDSTTQLANPDATKLVKALEKLQGEVKRLDAYTKASVISPLFCLCKDHYDADAQQSGLQFLTCSLENQSGPPDHLPSFPPGSDIGVSPT